jgi:hypothetical protein
MLVVWLRRVELIVGGCLRLEAQIRGDDYRERKFTTPPGMIRPNEACKPRCCNARTSTRETVLGDENA